MDKLRVILGACGIHLCIGSVYAWSVLTNPIMERTNWSLSEITFTFSLAILFLGFSAAFLGHKVKLWGPKKSAAIAMVFYISGLLGSSCAIEYGSIAMLYFFYGCIGGIGLGLGYIAPISSLLGWFPNAKGFAGGCAVMSFGFAAMVAGPIMRYFVETYGLIENFIYMSMIYATIMLLSVWLIKAPKPKVFDSNEDYTQEEIDYTPDRACHTLDFWILWSVFFINIASGIAILSIASPMVESLGMTPEEAAGLVGMVGLLNGGGRIFFASISDHIGRRPTYCILFFTEIIAFFVLSLATNPYLFGNLVLLIAACYGAGFSCMPSYLSDLFGNTHLSEIHGRILTAWGLAGIAGPLLLTITYEIFNRYDIALHIFSLLFVASLLIMGYIRKV
jgi:OFA family oxalate/formate antiporter-like MFS transporter